MKLFRLILVAVFFMLSVGIVSADLTTDNVLYYSFDENNVSGSTMLDLSGNGNDGTCFMDSNCDTVEGILINASDFDGTNDYIQIPDVFADTSGISQTFSVWFNADSFDSDIIIGNNGDFGQSITLRSPNLRLSVNDASGSRTRLEYSVNTSQWYHVVGVFNVTSTEIKLYVNGNLIATNSSWDGTYFSTADGFERIGQRNSGEFYDGRIDEIGIWNRVLNSTEITELYNSGAGNNPYDPITRITFNNPQNNEILNNTDFLLNLTFSQDTNASYIFNEGSEIDLCSNCNESSNTTLTGVEGVNNLTIITNTTGDLVNSSISFTIDTTNPVITDNIPSEINTYTLDFNSSTCTDTNLDSCTIEINSQTGNLLTETNINLTVNGNLSYIITANDTAGNTVNTTGVVFVKPIQYVRFFDNERSIFVEGYTVTIGSTDFEVTGEYLNLTLYEDVFLGTSTLEFVKTFYVPENFTLELNTTSDVNTSYNVTPVDFSLQVFDEDTLDQLTFNLTIQAENGTLYNFENQFNFSNFSINLPSGNLTLLVNSNGYSQRKFFTSNQPFTAVDIDLLLLNSSLTTPVIFQTLEASTRNNVADAELQFRKIVLGELRTVGEATTDDQGLTFFNMDALDEYEVTIIADGYDTETFTTIPGKTEYTLLLDRTTTSDFLFFNQLSYSITPESFNSIPFNTTAITRDSLGLISSMTYTVEGTDTFFTDTSTVSSGDTITFEITNFSNSYNLTLEISRGGETETVNRVIYFINETDSNFTINRTGANFLENEESPANRVIFMIFMYVFAMVVGGTLGGLATGSGTVAAGTGAMTGIIPLMYYVNVGFLNIGIAGLIIMATIVGVLFFRE